ncbi:MAG TPA: hypothetical protein VF802_03310, partial [Candidatus Limnocylindrales bacterium]
SLSEWWIDGSLAMDAGGNLYATWDTQGATEDVGWLAYSQDHGRHWSASIRATPDSDQAAHIMEVSGGPAGTAYVGTLTNAAPQGYALLLRPFAIGKGWLSDPVQVSPQFGDPSVWPGDTFGISTLAPGSLALSWGSGVVVNNQARSQVFATVATVTTR